MDKNLISLLKTPPEIFTLLYKDLAQPGVKQVGKALETVLATSNSLLLPLKLINHKCAEIFSSHMENYRKKLEEIPEEDIVSVAPEIGTSILDKLTFTTDDKISEIFIELLCKASRKQTVSSVHPSFINKIAEISPDEATIIAGLNISSYIPYINLSYSLKSDTSGGMLDLKKYLSGLEFEYNLHFKSNITLYLDNFISLGILYTDSDKHFSDTKIYDLLLNKYKHLTSEIESSKDKQLIVNKGIFEITDYGKLFIAACRKKTNLV